MVRYADLDPASTGIEAKIPVFNKTDMELASYLLNNTGYDIDSLQSDRDQITTLNAIATNIFHTKRPSQAQKEKVREHLSKLANKIEVKDRDSGYEYVWNILDHYEILPKDEHGVYQVNYAFGDGVKKNALQRKLLSVPTSKFNSLQSGYAKTLYFQLQLERIRLAQAGLPMTKSFSLGFFSKAMLLRYKGTAKIKGIVKEALEELKETELFYGYTVKGQEYIIDFVPLGKSELEDMEKVEPAKEVDI